MKINASSQVTRQTPMKTSETPLYPLEWLEFKQLKTPSVQEVPGNWNSPLQVRRQKRYGLFGKHFDNVLQG